MPLFVLIAAFGARLIQAKEYFLNPDEALHYLSASQPSVDLAYKAALTNAHPPLLILVLYYWHSFGHSELMLRLPSVLAGTACCWLTYLWLKEGTDRSIAFMGLLLVSFAPSLIGLSAEIRQYALLLFFMTGCLYLSERAIQENSRPLMAVFSLFLYGALLTHFPSLLLHHGHLHALAALSVWEAARLVRGVGQRSNRRIGHCYLFSSYSRRALESDGDVPGDCRNLAAKI